MYGDGDCLLGWEEVDWRTRQQARMDAQKLLDCYPAERVVFPDKHGEPQEFGAMSSLDMAARLLFLLDKAKQRKELHDSGGGKDQ